MNLLDLPQEIIIMIIKVLDQESVFNLYHVCSYLRNIICYNGIVKVLNLSCNTMATQRTLKTDFFKNISANLIDLNVSAMPDLCKSTFIQVLKRLKKLKKLNVSYTNIGITDLLDIYKACPTLKSINIDLNTARLSSEEITQLQDIFLNFDNVHFVGSIENLIYSTVIFQILQKVSLNSFTYTASHSKMISNPMTEIVPIYKFKQLNIYILHWENIFMDSIYDIIFYCKLVLSNYEYLVMAMFNCDSQAIYASPLIKKYCLDNLKMKPDLFISLEDCRLSGNLLYRFWDKNLVVFNDLFFTNLSKQLKQYLPYHITHNTENLFDFDAFYTIPNDQEFQENKIKVNEPMFKKARRGASYTILNYDSVFKGKNDLKLYVLFQNIFVTLSSSCEYLRKLTYLNLSGPARYSGEFFSILFRCSVNLNTLNVDAHERTVASISRSIPLSRSLKNLRLLDKRLDFLTLFSSLSQCSSLENIHLGDFSLEDNPLADPRLIFERCKKLYCFTVRASMTETVRLKTFRLFNKSKKLCDKPYLYLELINNKGENTSIHNSDPFLKVFCLSTLNPM